MRKIKTLSEIASIVTNLKEAGNKIIQCHGVFDIVHPGHNKHFEAAKKLGDILIVTVTPDKYVNKGPGRPVFNQRLRAESLAKNEDINYVVINEYPTAVEMIRLIRPDFYVKGSDYANSENDITGEIVNEKTTVESIGGKIHYTNEVSFSATSILNREFSVYPRETHEFLEEFREKYSAKDVINRLRGLSKMRVLVIGDAIIDQYCYCSGMNKSPKENIIPTRYLSEEMFAGGVLATANHIAGFCEKVHLVTSVGLRSSHIDFINSHLKPNILTKFFSYDAPTIVKRRFVEPTFLTKLFEICYIENGGLPLEISMIVEKYLEENVEEYDLVLVADFGHGFINKNMINILCDKAEFLAVNAQTNSANIGFNPITKYPRANYVCVDEPEIRFACRNKIDSLETLIKQIADEMNCCKVAVTHSKYETITFNTVCGFFRTPVFSGSVIDTMGAGDAFLSITSPLVASGAPMDLVGFVGNAVGALKVQIVGNKESVEPIPLFKFITSLLK